MSTDPPHINRSTPCRYIHGFHIKKRGPARAFAQTLRPYVDLYCGLHRVLPCSAWFRCGFAAAVRTPGAMCRWAILCTMRRRPEDALLYAVCRGRAHLILSRSHPSSETVACRASPRGTSVMAVRSTCPRGEVQRRISSTAELNSSGCSRSRCQQAGSSAKATRAPDTATESFQAHW